MDKQRQITCVIILLSIILPDVVLSRATSKRERLEGFQPWDVIPSSQMHPSLGLGRQDSLQAMIQQHNFVARFGHQRSKQKLDTCIRNYRRMNGSANMRMHRSTIVNLCLILTGH